MTPARDTLRNAVRYVEAEFESRGNAIKPSSRLDKLKRAIVGEDGSGFVPPNSPAFDLAVEALLEFRLLEYVFDHYPLEKGSAVESRMLRAIQKDSALPQDDLLRSSGRDVQLELYAGAICEANGFESYAFEEPDIVARTGGVTFKLAVKRAKSETGIIDLVRDGANQIREAGGQGIVVLDSSVAFNPSNQRVPPKHDDHRFQEIHASAVQFKLNRLEPRLREVVRGKGVLGIALINHLLRNSPSGPWNVQSLLMTMNLTTSRQRARQFALFHRQFNIEKGA